MALAEKRKVSAHDLYDEQKLVVTRGLVDCGEWLEGMPPLFVNDFANCSVAP